MTTYLLDSNVMIALASPSHPHKARCKSWYRNIDAFATCPITEGSFIRTMIHFGQTVVRTSLLLSYFLGQKIHEFWPDSVSYINADLSRVRGHKQVTDAYLVALVRAHPGSKLATLDEALAELYPEDVLLVPEPA